MPRALKTSAGKPNYRMKIKYLKTALVLLLSAVALISCERNIINPDWSDGVPDVQALFIGGNVFDSQNGETIEGVTVVLCAYEKTDLTRFYKPFYTDTTYSRQDGSYSFSYLKCMETRIYSVKTLDNSPIRQEHYRPGNLDLYLEQSSPCFNEVSKSYTITRNDLYLSKE